MHINLEDLKRELIFKTSRSGGAGGQHVNKVETKVTLLWNVMGSNLFSEFQKNKISVFLKHRINMEGFLQIEAADTRSQLSNKDIVVERFVDLLLKALTPVKKRIPTKIPRSKVLARLEHKSRQSQKKADRNWRSY